MASSLPAAIEDHFISLRQSVLPLGGSGYCRDRTGQRRTFSGQWLNLKHLLQGDAECTVSVSALLGLFFLCVALQVFKSKGRAIKERYSAFPARYFGSSEGTWIIFLPLFPFVHAFFRQETVSAFDAAELRACSLLACAHG